MDLRTSFSQLTAGLMAALGLILGAIGPASAQRGEEPPSESPNYQVQVVAHTLYTAPLTNFTHQEYECSVVNVGKSPIDVKVQIFRENGTDISEAVLPCDGELNPGAVCHMKVENGMPHVIVSAYCRILVVGNKENVRGLLKATTRGALDPYGNFYPPRSITAEAH